MPTEFRQRTIRLIQSFEFQLITSAGRKTAIDLLYAIRIRDIRYVQSAQISHPLIYRVNYILKLDKMGSSEQAKMSTSIVVGK